MTKNIYLIIGQSGSGKTTEVEILKKEYGLKDVASYTTRPQRHNNEVGHTFITEDTFNSLKDKMCAYTFFNGYHYGATVEQIDNANIYVIDLEGIKYMVNDYIKKGVKKGIKLIYIKKPFILRTYRILKRDGFKKAVSRILNDFKMFKELKQYSFDLIINNTSKKGVVAKAISDYIYNTEIQTRYF